MGNNKACKVFGIDSIKLRLHEGMEGILTMVRYVLDLKRNLISLGALEPMGYTIKVKNRTLMILKDIIVVMKELKKNGFYDLQGETIIGNSTVVVKDGDEAIKLWKNN